MEIIETYYHPPINFVYLASIDLASVALCDLLSWTMDNLLTEMQAEHIP